VRGFRIELGEIESVLARHAGVRESAVVVRPGAGGEPRLVAYVSCGGSESPGLEELRTFVAGELPEYMVPSAFVVLEKLPLTGNGKVDRRALPEPEGERPELGAGYAAPRTATEEALAQIWSEVLGVARVGVHDDFFALGGHSLLATQVISRIRHATGVDVPLRTLFEHPTVSELAVTVEEAMSQDEELDRIAAALAALDEMSDEEVQAVLADQEGQG
jgi:acyl carrier protein